MRKKKKSRILVVDDHPMVCTFLSGLVGKESDIEVIGGSGRAGEALVLAKSKCPDLMIIDISLENGNGLSLIKRIRIVNKKIRFLVFSSHDEKIFAQRSLNVGAQGFISKQEGVDKIIIAIRTVLAGKIYLSEPLKEQLLLDAYQDQQVEKIPSVGSLTPRELEVFEMIGRGLKTTEIAQQLHLGVKTIETHREKIKKKLHLSSALELTRRSMQWVMEHS